MDIYPFFNSKDIAEHLKSLNYAFTLPEAAFVVYQSQYRTLEEKFAAWRELIDTIPDCSCDLLTDEEDTLLRQFDGMCFAFPTPFHRGDILIDRSPHGREEPFVLDHISTWDAKTLRQNGYAERHPWEKEADLRLQKLLRSADSSDMNYAGCYLDCSEGAFPALYSDNFWTYLNLERYTHPLQGTNRVLKAVSSAMTYDPETGFSRIGPELLCHATWQILTEQTAQLSRSFLEIQYTEEGLQLAGLK